MLAFRLAMGQLFVRSPHHGARLIPRINCGRFGYHGLAKNANNSEAAAERAIQATPTELPAVSIMYDYLARATGPLIPYSQKTHAAFWW
jgi:hypothetical protein